MHKELLVGGGIRTIGIIHVCKDSEGPEEIARAREADHHQRKMNHGAKTAGII